MFFTNDPWWGALHANDGILVMPIFWEGELVAWSGIVMHDDDVGSPVPGSFVSGAHDRFGEAPLFPGIKMVEGLRAAVGRPARLPAQQPHLGAQRAEHARARRGAAHHLSAHQRADRASTVSTRSSPRRRASSSTSSGSCARACARSPTAAGSRRSTTTTTAPTTRSTRCAAGSRRRGDRLVFDLTGTSPQAPGPINCARPAMEGAIIGRDPDVPLLRPAVGDRRRCATSSRSSPSRARSTTRASPAAVSMASVMGTLSTQDVVAHAFAKMLLASRALPQRGAGELERRASAAALLHRGQPARRAVRSARSPTRFAGGGGARTFADGIDSGGIFHSMGSRMSNAETVEARVPALQLYRRELCDGGGAGPVQQELEGVDETEKSEALLHSPRLRVVPRGHHEVGAVGAALRAAKPQLGQRHVAATGLHDRIEIGVGLMAARVAEHQHAHVAVAQRGARRGQVAAIDAPGAPIHHCRQPGAPARARARWRHRRAAGVPPVSCRARRRRLPGLRAVTIADFATSLS